MIIRPGPVRASGSMLLKTDAGMYRYNIPRSFDGVSWGTRTSKPFPILFLRDVDLIRHLIDESETLRAALMGLEQGEVYHQSRFGPSTARSFSVRA